MKVILSFRYQLHKLKLLQGIYLSFASLFTIVSGLYWGLLSMQLASTLNYLWVLIGLIHGFLAWFFIPKEKTVKIIIYAILFSLLTLLIAKYIFYMHFFHLQSSFGIDKSVVSMALVIQKKASAA